MKTEKEIVEYYEAMKKDDFFGAVGNELISRLSFDKAKPFLKETETENEWKVLNRDKKTILKEMSEYMPFAWGKAIGHRGISANRSIDHFKAWLFLLGDEDLLKFAEENYVNYGTPILRSISEKYKFPIPAEAEDWKDGEPCRRDCEEGCSL